MVEGISVPDKNVVNTIHTYLPEVADKQNPLLNGSLFCSRRIVEKGTLRLGLTLPHCVTYMDEGVIAHTRGGKVFACEVGDPIPELVMMSCDEAELLAVKLVSYRECSVASISGGR